mmetsp:Transcript_21599/g.45599  ORF Transcript_21599/g.45599 Transcript_21599/m.45599 type:complete len:280 (-) Transcript_21599:163-1002(-)
MDGLVAVDELVRDLMAKAVAIVELDLAIDGPVALRRRCRDRLRKHALRNTSNGGEVLTISCPPAGGRHCYNVAEHELLCEDAVARTILRELRHGLGSALLDVRASLTLMVRRRSLGAAEFESTSSKLMHSTTGYQALLHELPAKHTEQTPERASKKLVACVEGIYGGKVREGQKIYLVAIAVSVEELGVQRVSRRMKGRAKILPAVRMDLFGGVLPRRVRRLNTLANEEHAVVNLAHDRLLAAHDAQQSNNGRSHLRCTQSTQCRQLLVTYTNRHVQII